MSPIIRTAVAVLVLAAPALRAQPDGLFDPLRRGRHLVAEAPDGWILAVDEQGAHAFASWNEYARSDFFLQNGLRCQGGALALPSSFAAAVAADCADTFNNPAAEYAFQTLVYRIPVVVHVFQSSGGSGNIPDALVASQIEILNQDFRALAGGNGAAGVDTGIEFFLAEVDPEGNPTTGVTRHVNDDWFNDIGDYGSAVGWDPTRYLNLYTNTADGALGYAYIPNGGGVVGQGFDGVRILWSAFGADAPIGPPYDQGRTATHEVGHYLGLYHTFQGGCAGAGGCQSNGDLICDTNPENGPNFNGCSRSTCSSVDPVKNYMDYSDDLCMNNFTEEQARRMRCTLVNWRPDLFEVEVEDAAPVLSIAGPFNGSSYPAGSTVTLAAVATDTVDGDLTEFLAWSSSLDGPLGTGGTVQALLSSGTHAITAQVTDSNLSTHSEDVTVTVLDPAGGVALTADPPKKKKGAWRVTLRWSGATTGKVKISRNGKVVTKTGNDGVFVDHTGIKAKKHGTITYEVFEPKGGAVSTTLVVEY